MSEYKAKITIETDLEMIQRIGKKNLPDWVSDMIEKYDLPIIPAYHWMKDAKRFNRGDTVAIALPNRKTAEMVDQLFGQYFRKEYERVVFEA